MILTTAFIMYDELSTESLFRKTTNQRWNGEYKIVIKTDKRLAKRRQQKPVLSSPFDQYLSSILTIAASKLIKHCQRLSIITWIPERCWALDSSSF